MAADAPKTEGQAGAVTTSESDFATLMNKAFRPRTDEAQSAIESSVKTLAAQALEQASLISDDALQSVENMIAEIDRKLSAQISEILHNEEFQKLEGAWRGLHYLINNSETDEMLKIRVLNVSKKDLHNFP